MFSWTRNKIPYYQLGLFILMFLIGCQTVPSARTNNRLLIFEIIPRSIRNVYTPYRWSVLDSLYVSARPVKQPSDFPKSLRNPQDKHNFHTGTWHRDVVTVVEYPLKPSKEDEKFKIYTPEEIFSPQVVVSKNVTWREALNNYYVVKTVPRIGPSVPSIWIFRRREDRTWEELVWIEEGSNNWGKGFNLDYEMSRYNELKRYDYGIPFPAYQEMLLDYALYLIENKGKIGKNRAIAEGEMKELDLIIERLHFWGEPIKKEPFGLETDNKHLTELFKKDREGIVQEWTKAGENYYILRIRYMRDEDEGDYAPIFHEYDLKYGHAYILLEYREKEGTYICRHISGKLQ